jgi:23S rRNA (pseudouridine1915-N3)-methyltransferase
MYIHILCIGETKARYLQEGQQDYLRRISHYCKIDMTLVREGKISKSLSTQELLSNEWTNLLKKIPERYLLVLLDQKRGKMIGSEELAEKFQSYQSNGIGEVVFVIGGPLGLHDDAFKRADEILSLSKMTFTHDMTRLILLEQIYRAFTILRGEKYHK